MKHKLLLGCSALLGLLLLAVAALYAYGASQPRDHVAASRATYAKPPEEVFARLADFGRWPEWNRSVTSMEQQPDAGGKPCWRLKGDFGAMPTVVEESSAPSRLVTRIPADAGLGFSGTWTYELAPAAGGGTTVAIREDGRVDNAFFRAFGALLMDPHATMDALLRDLGASYGETTAPEHVP
jgi:uncharacterized protein YndB with AHSA1/START domain